MPTTTPWLLWIALTLLAIAFFGIGWTLLTPSLQSRKELRVESIESYVVGAHRQSRSDSKAHQAPATEQLVAMADRLVEGRKSAKGTMALIERADLPFRAGEWFLIQVIGGVLGALLGVVLLRNAGGLGLFVGALLGAVVGSWVPTIFLRVKANRRANAFERLLPDILLLVSTSLRSGFGLPQALEAVARDASEPAAKEFSRALAETRIGTDIADALDRMAIRMASTSMRWTVMAIRIQRDVGGNLAETLKTTATTLREREALHRQVRTLSAEGRLSAYILIALPIGMFFYMMLVNYEYISRLWTTPFGLIMSFGAARDARDRCLLDAPRREDRGVTMTPLYVGIGLIALALIASVILLVMGSSGPTGSREVAHADRPVGRGSAGRPHRARRQGPA